MGRLFDVLVRLFVCLVVLLGWDGSVLEDFGCALCWVLVLVCGCRRLSRECVCSVCEFVKLPLNRMLQVECTVVM